MLGPTRGHNDERPAQEGLLSDSPHPARSRSARATNCRPPRDDYVAAPIPRAHIVDLPGEATQSSLISLSLFLSYIPEAGIAGT
ncbi:hypothetical protein VTH06DRAFT_6992 [Thermothelomyces fergusii]